MGRVSIDNLKAGMVLGEDATSGSNTLLAGGATLTDKHIEIFRSWGVDSVEIDGISDADINAEQMKVIDTRKIQATEKLLSPYFSLNNMKHPFIAELFRLSTLYKIRGEENNG